MEPGVSMAGPAWYSPVFTTKVIERKEKKKKCQQQLKGQNEARVPENADGGPYEAVARRQTAYSPNRALTSPYRASGRV